MNFNIITASFNSQETILDCLSSLNNQKYDKQKIKWFLIDGASKDNTLKLINGYKSDIQKKIISENDQGLFYAYNKGINQILEKQSSILNFLDSDNNYFSENIIEEISRIFDEFDVDVVFTDLIYVDKNDKVVRYWKSKPDMKICKEEKGIFFYDKINFFDHFFGWSMPLPTIFLKSSTLNKCGYFDTRYKICSDYDWSLRLSLIKNLKIAYLPKVSVKMRLGGVSNRFGNLIKIKVEDLKIIFRFYRKKNFFLAILFSFFTLVFKNLRKLSQFFLKT